MFCVIFFGLLFATLTQYAIYRYTAMRGYTIGGRVLRGYLSQPYAWFLTKHSADLGSTVLTEVNEVILRHMLPAMKLISQAAVAVFLVLMLVAVQPMAALGAAMLLGGSYALIFGVVRKRVAHMGKDAQGSQRPEVQGRGRGLRRHQGREAPRPRGVLPAPLRDTPPCARPRPMR